MEGYKSQITAVTVGLFTAINAFYPNALSDKLEVAITGLLVAAYGVFMAWKVERK